MKRYDCHVGEYFERAEGEFVRYEDHEAKVAKLTKRIEGHLAVLRMTTTESERQARQELSLAEEGLANYEEENQQLRALLTQAPIAKVTVREGCMANAPDDVYVKLYAPGLPYGEHDLYLMPSEPQPREQT